MDKETYERELVKTREFYFSLGSLSCPILDNKLVYFNQQGFRHFLRKEKGVRPEKDQLRRFYLFRTFIQSVVKSDKTFIKKVELRDQMRLWTIAKNIANTYCIRVVITKIRKGPYFYLSIMDEGNKNSG